MTDLSVSCDRLDRFLSVPFVSFPDFHVQPHDSPQTDVSIRIPYALILLVATFSTEESISPLILMQFSSLLYPISKTREFVGLYTVAIRSSDKPSPSGPDNRQIIIFSKGVQESKTRKPCLGRPLSGHFTGI